MKNNIYRNAKMGTWVLIYDEWYEPRFFLAGWPVTQQFHKLSPKRGTPMLFVDTDYQGI